MGIKIRIYILKGTKRREGEKKKRKKENNENLNTKVLFPGTSQGVTKNMTVISK